MGELCLFIDERLLPTMCPSLPYATVEQARSRCPSLITVVANEYQSKGQQRSVCQNQSAMNAKLKSLSENPHKPPIAGDCLHDRTVSLSPSGFPAHLKFSSETPALRSLTLEEQATLPPWRFSDLLLKAFLQATLLSFPFRLPLCRWLSLMPSEQPVLMRGKASISVNTTYPTCPSVCIK